MHQSIFFRLRETLSSAWVVGRSHKAQMQDLPNQQQLY
jgi:hypothetical protein